MNPPGELIVNALELPTIALRFGVAALFALPVGWDRASRSRSAGLRTYPLVAIGTCAFALTGVAALGTSADEQADVLYGILTGVGFIGGGAVLKTPDALRGMATMVSLWVTVAIGTAVAHGLYVLGFALSVLSVAGLHIRARTPAREKGRS